MREILFRGKRADNGEWLFGDLRHIFHGEYRTHIVDNSNGLNNGVCGLEVASSTVGQFTGLTDRDGVKIFEGDILRVTDEHKEYITFVHCVDNTLCVDIFVDNTGVLEFDYNYTAIGFAEDFWKNQSCKVEIIGNIHDNPELLEVSGDEP